MGEQLNIEAQTACTKVERFFVRPEQIREQSREADSVQCLGDMTIAWTVPAASAAVHEQHEGASGFRNAQYSPEYGATRRDQN